MAAIPADVGIAAPAILDCLITQATAIEAPVLAAAPPMIDSLDAPHGIVPIAACIKICKGLAVITLGAPTIAAAAIIVGDGGHAPAALATPTSLEDKCSGLLLDI